jgi:hypothetical protein
MTTHRRGFMADREQADDGILVQVCIECGREYFFNENEPPTDLVCEKCGGTVFRSFDADPTPDDAAEEFAETTERDVDTDDPATDVTRGDLHDLNNV